MTIDQAFLLLFVSVFISVHVCMHMPVCMCVCVLYLQGPEGFPGRAGFPVRPFLHHHLMQDISVYCTLKKKMIYQ